MQQSKSIDLPWRSIVNAGINRHTTELIDNQSVMKFDTTDPLLP